MPRIDTLETLGKKKTFKKKTYRPWDLLDDHEEANRAIEKVEKVSISNQLVANKDTISNPKETKKEPVSIIKDTINNQKAIEKEPIKYLNSNRNNQPISNPKDTQKVTTELVADNVSDDLKRLYGLQRKILFYIVSQCIAKGELTSGPIPNEVLREVTNTDVNTVKTAVQRLIQKGFVTRERGKRGKGGFAVFRITSLIRSAVLEERKLIENSNQLVTQMVTADYLHTVTNKVSNKEPASSSSSSYINNNKTTTTEGSVLPPDWQEIDLSELQKRHVRFGSQQLAQVYPYLQHFLAFDVQESLDGFVYDIDHHHINTNNPRFRGYLNLLMGTLRSGALYVSSHYVSPAQQAIMENLERLKQKQAQQEEIGRLQAEAAFREWLEAHREEVAQKLPNTGWQIPFQHNDKEILEWVRKNIYEKQMIKKI